MTFSRMHCKVRMQKNRGYLHSGIFRKRIYHRIAYLLYGIPEGMLYRDNKYVPLPRCIKYCVQYAIPNQNYPALMTPSAWLEHFASVEPPERVPLFLSRQFVDRYPLRFFPGLNDNVPYYLEDLPDIDQSSLYSESQYDTEASEQSTGNDEEHI